MKTLHVFGAGITALLKTEEKSSSLKGTSTFGEDCTIQQMCESPVAQQASTESAKTAAQAHGSAEEIKNNKEAAI